MNSGAEMSLSATGSIAIKLHDLTKGFLPDFSIDIFQTNFLVTLGKNSASGLPAGFYLHATLDVLKNFLDSINNVFDKLNNIMSKLGLSIPKIKPSSKLKTSIFIQKEVAGFVFDIPKFPITCIFKFASSKGSCNLNGKFFSAVFDKGGKWVINKANKLFELTGAKINDVGDFSKRTAIKAFDLFKKGAKKAGEFLDNAGNTISNAAVKVGDAVSNAANTTQNAVSNAAVKVGDAVSNAANTTQNAVSNAANTTKNAVSNAANTTKNAVSNAANTTKNAVSNAVNSFTNIFHW